MVKRGGGRGRGVWGREGERGMCDIVSLVSKLTTCAGLCSVEAAAGGG